MSDNNSSKYVYGKNPIREKLKKIKSGVLFIQKNIQTENIKDIINNAKSKKLEIVYIDNNSFKKFFGEKKQGLVLKIEEEYSEEISEEEFIKYIKTNLDISTILILDSIKDVGNLGAIIRSALLFGVEYIILPKNRSAPITDTVAKCSAGALFHIKIVYVTNIIRIIDELKNNGYWIYAANTAGDDISKIKFTKKSAVILGEEHEGIRQLVKKNSDILIKIPTNNKIDSLNVSVSAGIILYEIYQNINK